VQSRFAQQDNDGDNDAENDDDHRCIEDQVAKALPLILRVRLRISHNLPGTQQPGLLHFLHALLLLTLRISSACTRKKRGRIIWVARACSRRCLALRRLAHGSGRRVTFRTSRSLPLSGFGHRRRGMLTLGASRLCCAAGG
jgi:hypothetical protein